MTSTQSPAKRTAGLVLIVTGLFWATISAFGSIGIFLMFLAEVGGDFAETLSILPMILLVGSFSVGLGYVLYTVGQALRPPD